MSETPSQPDDELKGSEQPFVAHLIELRDRLMWAVAAVALAAAALAIYPGPGNLYDISAAPLVVHLPKGATLIQLMDLHIPRAPLGRPLGLLSSRYWRLPVT
jgi:sec-independent protein translocase protein TatC